MNERYLEKGVGKMQQVGNLKLVSQLNKNYVGGKWIDGASGRDYTIRDPYDNSEVATVKLANLAQIKEAFQLAKEAQKKWKKSTSAERRTVLTRARDYLVENKNEIVQLIVRETGGTYLKAEVEFSFGLSDIEEAIKMVDEIYVPREFPSPTPNKVNRVYRLPKGVITSITPFNFPFNMATRTVFPAIALGNSAVHKPDVQVGLCGGQVFAKAFEEAGLPVGVLIPF
jgi:aldehyde dehydrogenase (NAD+)